MFLQTESKHVHCYWRKNWQQLRPFRCMNANTHTHTHTHRCRQFSLQYVEHVCLQFVKTFHFIFLFDAFALRSFQENSYAQLKLSEEFLRSSTVFQGFKVLYCNYSVAHNVLLTLVWLLDHLSNRFQVNPQMRGLKQTVEPTDFFSSIVPRKGEFDTCYTTYSAKPAHSSIPRNEKACGCFASSS